VASSYFLVLGFILPTYTLDALIQVINLVEINHLILRKSTIRKKVHLRKCNLHGIGQHSQARTLFSKAQYRDHIGCMGMSCRSHHGFFPSTYWRNKSKQPFFFSAPPLVEATNILHPSFLFDSLKKRRGLFSALYLDFSLMPRNPEPLHLFIQLLTHVLFAFVIHCFETKEPISGPDRKVMSKT